MADLKKYLTKRDFLTVTLKDGSEQRMRSLTRGELRYLDTLPTRKEGERSYANDALVAMCTCDEDGNQSISCDDAITGVFDALHSYDWHILLKCALELCYGDRDKPIGQLVEDAVKN